MIVDQVVRSAVGRPRATIAAWFALVAVSMVGVAHLQIDTSTSSFLDRGSPAWGRYQRSIERFGGDEFVAIALEGNEPLAHEVLSALPKYSASLEQIPGVRRVDSLATVGLIRQRDAGGLNLDPGLRGGAPEVGSREWELLLDDVRADPLVQAGLISADGRVVAINVLLDEDVAGDRAQTVEQVRAAIDDSSALISGVPIFRTAVNARTRLEVVLFLPLTLCVVVALLFAMIRSLALALLAVGVGGVGSIVTLGAMGFLGVSLSLSTMILPSTLLALGCAYSAHAVLAVAGVRGDALEFSLVEVGGPIALSGLTTAIGFLVMATVSIDAIRELATYGALGVVVLTGAALSLAPAVLRARVDASGSSSRPRSWPAVEHLASLSVRKPGVVAIAWVLLAGGFAVGAARLSISTDIIQWFDRDSRVRSDYEEIRERLAGITPVNVVVASEEPEGAVVTDPHVLEAVQGLSEALEREPGVGKVVSLPKILARMHEVVAGGSAEIPPDRAVVAQYLLLLDGVQYLRDVLSWDEAATNIMLRVNTNSSDEIVALGSIVDGWWARHGVSGFGVTTTGIMYEFGRAEEAIAYGQIRGLSLAVGVVAAILFLVLQSWRLVIVALLPNAAPVAVAFGWMGVLDIPLDAATVCLGTLALGIAVDDTIHVMVRYQRAIAERSDVDRALLESLRGVLPALVVSTASICGGFLVLGLSEFTLIRHLGIVTAALVGLCLLADVTLLPALVKLAALSGWAGRSPTHARDGRDGA